MQVKTKFYIFAGINSVLGASTLLGVLANFRGIFAIIAVIISLLILFSGIYLFKANENSRLIATLVSSVIVPINIAQIALSLFYFSKNSSHSGNFSGRSTHPVDGLGIAARNMELIAAFFLLVTGILLLLYFSLQFFIMLRLRNH